MRNILFLGVLLALLWVGLNKVQEIRGVSAATGGKVGVDLGLPSESPFATNFAEQYLCYNSADSAWQMFGDRSDSFASDCTGPYIDSKNLCKALEGVGERSVVLWQEGRTLRCSS